MQINLAVAKIDKFGSGKSGDTVETIERPNGGMSVVLADGEINKNNSKAISTMVSHRIIDHIGNGIRDGAALRGTSNSIFSEHEGHVIAKVNVLSVDLQTNTILISRNHDTPVFLIENGEIDCLSGESEPIGSQLGIIPSIVELGIHPGLAVIVFSDGVYHAGSETDHKPDICTTIEAFIEEQEPPAQEIAEFLLNQAIGLDNGRPKDDMTVLVLEVTAQTTDRIRRMNVSMTLDE